jgi:site-specific DNA-cytosine methylase
MEIVDLFSGIGAVAEAARGVPAARVAAAYDLDRQALQVGSLNQDAAVHCGTLESVGSLASNDCWWLSPPCQPYTRRGAGRGADDPRSGVFASLLPRLAAERPRRLALENVPPFADSEHAQQLIDRLDRLGYQVVTAVVCPTQLGIPNRRRRFYLMARRDGRPIRWTDPGAAEAGPPWRWTVASRLEEGPVDPAMWIDPALSVAYAGALDRVDPADPAARTACFTAAYGKSPVRSGSYLESAGRLRRFTPREVQRLLGFDDRFVWPESIPTRRRWQLLGNSLSVPVVRRVLEALL